MGSVSAAVTEDVLFARALLSRVLEPANIPGWAMVRGEGPLAAAEQVRAGFVDGRRSEAIGARADQADPYADLEAAQRHGMRLVVPESAEWPHFAFAALEAAGLRRLATYRAGHVKHDEHGELIPPLALWVRGTIDPASVGVRSVAIVGSRSATAYGNRVATDLAYQLAQRDFVVVSGGAYGIDAAAHRGALAASGDTVLVSAGGLDRPYPPSSASLFDRAAGSGLLVSESPPGAAPQRRRFLTRNRLIAALGTGTIVVEAARRSGAMNTAGHCTGLGRPRMAVPGPITSGVSAGCHQLLVSERDPARLVTGVEDVLATIGSASDLSADPATGTARGRTPERSARIDDLDPAARQVFDGIPARGWISADRLVLTSGLPIPIVLQALPALELHGLVQAGPEGYRLAPA